MIRVLLFPFIFLWNEFRQNFYTIIHDVTITQLSHTILHHLELNADHYETQESQRFSQLFLFNKKVVLLGGIFLSSLVFINHPLIQTFWL